MSLGELLGRGILRPFVLDEKGDFANSDGSRILNSDIGQILGTRAASGDFSGELPWRGAFGSKLYLLRHRNIDVTTQELARTWAAEALALWEPRVMVTGVDVVGQEVPGYGEVAIAVKVRYRPRIELARSNISIFEESVQVPLE